MANETQLERYRKLLAFMEQRYKDDVQIKDIEEAAHYSYRQMNRIFQALHHETIGQHLKRRKLEKAMEYLKYSDAPITDIAFMVGYNELSAFSKAFKQAFGTSPAAYRNTEQLKYDAMRQAVPPEEVPPLPYTLVEMPAQQVLCLDYRGSYSDLRGINRVWDQLLAYAHKQQLLHEETMAIGEILDDFEITEALHCRYTACLALKEALPFEPKALFYTKTIAGGSYAKFVHKGSQLSADDTYQHIYAMWVFHIPHELDDRPVLEVYVNHEEGLPEEELLTEIYIPVMP